MTAGCPPRAWARVTLAAVSAPGLSSAEDRLGPTKAARHFTPRAPVNTAAASHFASHASTASSIDPRPPALASRPASCSPLNEPSNPDSFPQILFFSACVAGLVVSARPEFWTVERDVVPDGMGAALGGNVDDVLVFDDTWFPQGKTADEVKIDHAGIGAENRKQEDFEPQSGFERWRGAPYWQHYTEMPVEYNLPRARMQAKDVVVATHTTDKDASKLFMASIHKHGLAATGSNPQPRRRAACPAPRAVSRRTAW